MCRKTVEGICKEHGIKDRNLSAGLKSMRDKELIEKRLFEWADVLRVAGNEAAHGVDFTVKADDARDLLDFTSALLEYLFSFREKFEQFKKRRSESERPAE